MKSVNLNKSSQEELTTLPGIGSVKATSIIKSREVEKFKDLYELSRVRGIGPSVIDKIKCSSIDIQL